MSLPGPNLLIALADAARGEALARALEARGIASVLAPADERACERLEDGTFLAILLSWEGEEGGAFPRSVVARFPDVPVIALAPEETALVVAAMRAGAWDVLPQSPSAEALATAGEVPPPPPADPSGLVGQSRAMEQVHELVRRAAPGMATVLVRGESGTGKELVARALHARSPRAGGPFVKVHCAALPDTLLESELFGYEKGAFTGATARKPGRVEVAERGTLFLDEIGDVNLSMQVKLLRLLQDREYERLGSSQTRRADVRFVTATHRNLEAMVKRGEYREDLFYRLNVVPLWLPPLRARHGDIPLLARHFCAVLGAANGRPNARLTDGALAALQAERWPGNVRQLQNFIERLVVLTEAEPITEADVSRELSLGVPLPTVSRASPGEAPEPARPPADPTTGAPLLPLTEEVRRAERAALVRALKRAKGNRVLAARLLGVGRATLYKKMQEYGVS